MDKKQRNQNRENARMLEYFANVCPECGERGKHWVAIPKEMSAITGIKEGFWTCNKFYGPDGRRLNL